MSGKFVLIIYLIISFKSFSMVHSTFDGINVIAVGVYGYIYYSSNSGTSWTRGASRTTTSTLYCVTHASKFTAMAGGTNAYVARTTDGGATWTNMTVFSSSTVSVKFHAISMLSDSVAYVSGDNGDIFRTLNSGTSWTKLISTGNFIYSLAMYDFITGAAGATAQVGIYTSVAGMQKV